VKPPLVDALSVPQRVLVVGVAAVDDDVIGLKHLQQGGDDLIGRATGRDHRLGHPRRRELLDKFLEGLYRDEILLLVGQVICNLDGAIVADHSVTISRQSARHLDAHLTQSNDSKLYLFALLRL
jgi:hypothetical protein